MRKSKTPVEPTFEERAAASHAKAGAALSIFEQIAADLEQAAVEQLALSADIDSRIQALEDEIERLNGLAYDAENAAEAYDTQSHNVRTLAGLA
jgi:hypothetical protein